MEIKFAEPLASTLTFEDVAVGQVFHWSPNDGHGLRLKISRTEVFLFALNERCTVPTNDMKDTVCDVAEIESITLRRIK